jgi:hypothetical protein
MRFCQEYLRINRDVEEINRLGMRYSRELDEIKSNCG